MGAYEFVAILSTPAVFAYLQSVDQPQTSVRCISTRGVTLTLPTRLVLETPRAHTLNPNLNLQVEVLVYYYDSLISTHAPKPNDGPLSGDQYEQHQHSEENILHFQPRCTLYPRFIYSL